MLPKKTAPNNPGIDLYMPYDYELSGGEESSINLQCRISIPLGYFGLLVVKNTAAQRHRLSIGNPVVSKSNESFSPLVL